MRITRLQDGCIDCFGTFAANMFVYHIAFFWDLGLKYVFQLSRHINASVRRSNIPMANRMQPCHPNGLVACKWSSIYGMLWKIRAGNITAYYHLTPSIMHCHTGYNQVKTGEAEVPHISVFNAYILDSLDILKAFPFCFGSHPSLPLPH